MSTKTQQLNDYLNWCEFNRRMTPATMKTKRQCINKFLDEHPYVSDFRDISNRELDDWAGDMIQQGKRGKTVNNYLDHVTACLRFLRDKRGEQLSVRLEALDRIMEEQDDLPTFDASEVTVIKQNCRGLRDLLLVSLIFESALRIKEVANLKVRDFNGRHIRIRGKGGKLRDTFILADTRELLDRWLLLSGIDDGYVFPSPTNDGDHLTVTLIRVAISAPVRKAGFDEGSAHALRRSSITAALSGGMYIHDAAKWAGHSDPRTTLKHYYKVAAKELGERHEQAFANITQNSIDNKRVVSYI